MEGTSKGLILAISYSLPHLISHSASAIYVGYLGLLYINIYKWKAEDFGKVYAFYFISTSISQFVFSMILQYVITSPNEVTGLKNCKILQVTNITTHALSLFFLILLPILKLRYEKRDLEECEEGKSVDIPRKLPCLLNGRFFLALIYLCTFFHGYGWGTFEVCNCLIPTYITRDATYLSSTNSLIAGLSLVLAPVLLICLNKIIGKKYPDYTPYLGIGTILLVLLVPVSVVFYIFTQKFVTGSATDASDIVPTTSNLDYPVLGGLMILQTIHGVYFMSCPAIIQYISTHILDDDADFRIYASAVFLLFFFLGSVFYKAFSQIVTLPKKTVSYLCIASFSLGYLLLFPYRYSWNKKGVVHYIVMAVFNIFTMIYFINTNIIITNQLADDNHKKYRWLLQGIICLFLNVVVSFLMKLVYKVYDSEPTVRDAGGTPAPSSEVEDAHEGDKEGKVKEGAGFKLNFRNLYILIFMLSQVAGLISTALYKEHVFE